MLRGEQNEFVFGIFLLSSLAFAALLSLSAQSKPEITPPQAAAKEKPDSRKRYGPSRYYPQRSPIGIAAFINAYRNEKNTDRAQERGEYIRNFSLQVVTLFFLILTTIAVFVQAYILHHTERINVRPWVGLTDDIFPPIQTNQLTFDKGRKRVGYLSNYFQKLQHGGCK
jgi:hypothetical protein